MTLVYFLYIFFNGLQKAIKENMKGEVL